MADDDPPKQPTMPWGVASLQPSSMSKISSKKLKAFTDGRMNTTKKKNPHQLKKEADERKKREAEQDAAKAFAEFKEYYDESPTKVKSFVRGDVIQQGDDGQVTNVAKRERKLWKPDDELRRKYGGADPFATSAPPPPPPSSSSAKPKKGAKKKSQMELFKEKIKLKQAEDAARRALKTPEALAREDELAKLPPPPDNSGGTQKGSFDHGDPTTTNLYVGNLSPQMAEADLCRLFGKFGPLASVKIMWPRTAEEKSRGRMCGFVAFMLRKDGAACLEELRGSVVMGFEMKLGWGKAVPLPPRPFYVHAATTAGKKLKTGLPFNAQPKPVVAGMSGVVFSNDIEAAYIVVVIPTERAVRQLIHRTIEFVIREGPEFEELLIQRTKGDQKYKFLIENATHEHAYYRWKLFSLLQGDRVDRWTKEPFKMFTGGSEWEPPEEDQVKQTEEVEKGHLSTDGRDTLEDLLHGISLERRSIAEAMVFCIGHAEASQEVIDCIAESLSILETPIMTKVARLFLVSDILSNCSAHVRNASSYRQGFEAKLPQIFRGLHETFRSFTSRLRAETFRQYVAHCLAAWRDWNVFGPDFFLILQNLFKYGSKEKPADPVRQSAGPVAAPASGQSWLSTGGGSAATDPDDEDVDGIPLEDDTAGAAADDDDDDLDGEPLEPAPASASAPSKRPAGVALSKWDTDDDDDDDDDDAAAAAGRLSKRSKRS